ncbi:MAG: ABC transporter ATP-binding protein [Gammaproteobacteria bacterium]|nr:ABC transporter ATP-binding protein [Gammaproteobacteria bacterium]
METLIQVSGLHKQFDLVHAVRGIDLSVARGDVLGFLGPNGAGKSTTMKMITGFLTPTAGDISIAGFDIASHPLEAKRRIGYLPEGAPAWGEMTARTFLDFIADVRQLTGDQRRRRIDTVVEQVHLDAVLDQPIDTLSKGFRRRVGLAQAILHDPEVLILDEPTDGLDPNQKFEVRSLIGEMAADKAIVISTHILEEVEALCTRATIIADGSLLFEGTPDELAARSPNHNAVHVTVADGDAEQAEAIIRAQASVGDVRRQTPGAAGLVTLAAVPVNGQRILESLSQSLHDSAVTVRALREESGRLDDVFRQITQGGADGEVSRT